MLAQTASTYSQKKKAFSLKHSYSKCAEDIGASLESEYKIKQYSLYRPLSPLSPSSETKFAYTDSRRVDRAEPEEDELHHLDIDNLISLIYDEEKILQRNGYKKIRNICDTQQGKLIEAVASDAKETENKVIIKKVSKALHSERIVRDHVDAYGMTYCTPKDVIKETLILKHLTVENQAACRYIIQEIELFDCDEFYYLVLEHVGNNSMNLKEFADEAHRYILLGQLDIKQYIKIIKFIFWQLFVLMHWMHNDMSCCHLDLKLEHVLLKDVKFVIDTETNTVTVNQNMSIKLCDFGSAELFKDGKFACDKIMDPFTEIQYKCPQLVEDQRFDARKADIWALGMMFFHCCIGRPLYSNLLDAGYIALKDNVFGRYLKACNLQKYVKKNMFSLVLNTLNTDEEERFSITEVVQHQYFNGYRRKKLFQECLTPFLQEKVEKTIFHHCLPAFSSFIVK